MTERLTNPAGRLDILALRLAQEAVRLVIDPLASHIAKRRVSLWPVLEGFATQAVKNAGIPERPITAEDVFALTAPKRRRRCRT